MRRHLKLTSEQLAWLASHGYPNNPPERRVKVRLYDFARSGAKGGRNGKGSPAKRRSARAAARARWDRAKQLANTLITGNCEAPLRMAPDAKLKSIPRSISGSRAKPLRSGAKLEPTYRDPIAKVLRTADLDRICEFCGCPRSQCPNIPECTWENP